MVFEEAGWSTKSPSDLPLTCEYDLLGHAYKNYLVKKKFTYFNFNLLISLFKVFRPKEVNIALKWPWPSSPLTYWSYHRDVVCPVDYTQTQSPHLIHPNTDHQSQVKIVGFCKNVPCFWNHLDIICFTYFEMSVHSWGLGHFKNTHARYKKNLVHSFMNMNHVSLENIIL